MLQQTLTFFTSAFFFPGLGWPMVLVAVGLAFAYGAIWLAPYRPPLVSRPQLWLVAVAGALLTWTTVSFIQTPLQGLSVRVMQQFWDETTITQWLLLTSIPAMLLSGLVQEASKLVPVLYYRRRHARQPTAKALLIAGAMSGVGFGVFEAVRIHNSMFASGWAWSTVEAYGFPALLVFIERFFAVGIQTALTALAAYGIGKRLGCQFYLIAAAAHAATNYCFILMQAGPLTSVQLTACVAVIAVALTIVVLRLRSREVPEDADRTAASATEGVQQ